MTSTQAMPSAQPNFAPTTANLGFDSKNALAFRPTTLRQRSVPLCNAPAATMESFLQSRSRVIRFIYPGGSPALLLSQLFLSPTTTLPEPVSLWTLRVDLSPSGETTGIWVVFKTHEQASTVLELNDMHSAMFTTVPALESELEPFEKLQRFHLHQEPPAVQRSQLPSPLVIPSCQQLAPTATRFCEDSTFGEDFTLSSNPPNPRTNFRVGDWICNTRNCTTHNFGRNASCISCGTLRTIPPSSPMYSSSAMGSGLKRPMPSPRFATTPNSPAHFSPSAFLQQQQHLSESNLPSGSQSYPASPKTAHPLLTPSGRAFAIGGRVQNLSNDPLAPCIMFWPDNEPLPEQGQIRPSSVVGTQQPPILNTGNRGPISHQPGDWICQKCNYLNWRRRKVCQTCLPYAEGNGDSISAAVQNERIALLTSVLANTRPISDLLPVRSHSMTPPQVRASPFLQHQPQQLPLRNTVYRSQSQFELGSNSSKPIYQTSGYCSAGAHGQSSQYATAPQNELYNSQVHHQVYAPAPAPYLPSFLQDIVQSPSLSPSSSSSAELSAFEEADDLASSLSSLRLSGGGKSSASSTHTSPLSSIWKFDGGESKSMSSFPFSSSRSSSLERASRVQPQN